MKKLSISIVLIVLGSFLAAQNILKFNRIYSVFPGIPTSSSSVIPSNDGYVVYGQSKDSSGNDYVTIVKFDTLGILKWNKSYRKTGLQYYSTWIYGGGGVYVPWGGYTGTGWITNDSGTWSDAALFRFDGKGDTIWTRKYNDSAQIQCTALKVTRDKKYIIGGYWISPSNNYTATLMKTDSLGNKMWQKNYAVGLSCLFGGIDTCKDKGFIMTLVEDYAAGANNIYVIKTDSLGNVQWTKVLSDTIPNSSVGGWGISTLSNGEYELCGYYEISSNYPNHPEFYLAKLNGTGNVQWARRYYYSKSSIGSNLFMIRELANKDIITCGYGYDTNSNAWGTIMKVDSNGNKVWLKSYLANVSQDALNDIRPTNDGGFVSSGTTYGSTQNIWIIKTDSNGCADSSGCVFAAVKQVTNQSEQVKIYPNPNSGKFVLQLEEVTDGEILEIYNVLGEKVYASEVVSVNTQIDLTTKPGGVYLYRVVTETGKLVSSGKFIIQK